jgi:hypothetical protein
MPPLELVLDLLLRLVLPCVVATALVIGLAVRFLERRWRPLALAAGASLGLLAGNWLRRPLPYWPDDTGWPALLPATIAALLFSGAAVVWAGDPRLRIALYAFAAAILAGVLLPGDLRTLPWFTGLALLILATAVVLDLAASPGKEERRDWALPLAAATVVCGGAAAVLIYSHSARLADAAVLLSAALLGVAAIAWLLPLDMRPLALTLAASAAGLMLSGHHSTFSEVPAASFALVALAPLLLGVASLPALQRWLVPRSPDWGRVAVQFALPLISVAVAVALAIRAEGWQLGY